MKYVRTKDKILPYYDKSKTGKLAVVLQVVDIIRTNKVDEKFDEIVLKQADTIEELFDVIVCRNELFYPLTSNREGNEFDWEEINRFRTSVAMDEETYNKIKQTTNDFEPYHWKVYGAIWTDKGLIYVAKMNEKGELELI
jgi:hypothetical protein